LTIDALPSTDVLSELADKAAISELISRLGLWLDGQQFDDAALAEALFTADATVETSGGTARGRDGLVEQARRVHAHHVRTHHVTTNFLIDLDGDIAVARANLIVTFVEVEGPPAQHRWVGERYTFGAARTPGGWRLNSIAIKQIWKSDDRPDAGE
jgi:hypothetical protein